MNTTEVFQYKLMNIKYDPFKMDSEGTCFQQTPCIKWTLAPMRSKGCLPNRGLTVYMVFNVFPYCIFAAWVAVSSKTLM